MSFESSPPRVYLRNKTDVTLRKIKFKFENGTMDSKIRKIKGKSKEQAAIPVWGVKLEDGAYKNLKMIHEVDGKVFEDIVLERYDKKMNLLVEILSINNDGSFEFSSSTMSIDDKG